MNFTRRHKGNEKGWIEYDPDKLDAIYDDNEGVVFVCKDVDYGGIKIFAGFRGVRKHNKGRYSVDYFSYDDPCYFRNPGIRSPKVFKKLYGGRVPRKGSLWKLTPIGKNIPRDNKFKWERVDHLLNKGNLVVVTFKNNPPRVERDKIK